MKTHRLLIIGWAGARAGYVDVTRAEAIAHYEEVHGSLDGEPIQEFVVQELRWAEDVWREEAP